MFKFTTAALAIGLLAAAPALAQADTQSPTRSAPGEWLYDGNGTLVGSVYALTDNGRTAIVQVGSYLTPGRRLVSIPASDLAVVGGHAVLTGVSASDIDRLPAVG